VASDGFWKTDEHLRFTYIFDPVRKYLDVSPGILIGKAR
jgi:hypothetical protein